MQEKLWTGVKTKANVRMSIRGYANELQIGKDVIRVLGAPAYITLKLNKNMDSIMIVGASDKQKLSFKVPAGYYLGRCKQMRVSSKSFVSGILSYNGLDVNATYQFEGVYSEVNNAVIFDLNEAEEYSVLGKRVVSN